MLIQLHDISVKYLKQSCKVFSVLDTGSNTAARVFPVHIKAVETVLSKNVHIQLLRLCNMPSTLVKVFQL